MEALRIPQYPILPFCTTIRNAFWEGLKTQGFVFGGLRSEIDGFRFRACSISQIPNLRFSNPCSSVGMTCKARSAAAQIAFQQQNWSTPVFQGAPMVRLFKDIVKEIRPECTDLRFSPEAVEALLMAATTFGVEFLVKAGLCAAHAKRVTVEPKDVQLPIRLDAVKVGEVMPAEAVVPANPAGGLRKTGKRNSPEGPLPGQSQAELVQRFGEHGSRRSKRLRELRDKASSK